MKKAAEKENRTLNNFVECLLLNSMYHEPNEATKAAIEEARSGQNHSKVYTDVDEMLNDIFSEDK